MNDAKRSGKDTSNASNYATDTITGASTSASDAITRSSDTYIYDVDVVAVLVIGVCVYFVHNKISS